MRGRWRGESEWGRWSEEKGKHGARSDGQKLGMEEYGGREEDGWRLEKEMDKVRDGGRRDGGRRYGGRRYGGRWGNYEWGNKCMDERLGGKVVGPMKVWWKNTRYLGQFLNFNTSLSSKKKYWMLSYHQG